MFQNKSTLITAALCLCIFSINALGQSSIIKAEYKIDDGESVELTLDNTSFTHSGDWMFTSSIDSSNLSIGPHEISVRFQDDTGIWSYWDKSILRNRFFSITGKQTLVAAEWFIDSDPGAGNGTTIPLPDDGSWDGELESLTIDTIDSASLSLGAHTLYIRCKDADGNWGKTNQCVFEIAPPLSIRAAEWVIDPTTPPGEGHPMYAADGTFDSAQEELVSDNLRYADFAPDTVIYIRVQDTLNFNVSYDETEPDSDVRGRWSSWNGWRNEATIVINPSTPLEPTSTPTVTPTPVVSSPTFTPTPVIDDGHHLYEAALINTYEFSDATLTDCGWMEIPGGFENRKSGIITVPSLFGNLSIPSSNDQIGIQINVGSEEVSMIVCNEAVLVEQDYVLMKVYLRTGGDFSQIVVGSLKGDLLTSELVDGSLSMNISIQSKSYKDQEGVMTVLFVPDEGNIVTPFIQVSNSNLIHENTLIDRVEIFSLQQQ
jgi:hypothetical protein